jgi:cytochrome c oxidase assembly factor CtaG
MRMTAAQSLLKTPLLVHGRPVERCLQARRFAVEGVLWGTVFLNHDTSASAWQAGSSFLHSMMHSAVASIVWVLSV